MLRKCRRDFFFSPIWLKWSRPCKTSKICHRYLNEHMVVCCFLQLQLLRELLVKPFKNEGKKAKIALAISMISRQRWLKLILINHMDTLIKWFVNCSVSIRGYLPNDKFWAIEGIQCKNDPLFLPNMVCVGK